MFSVSWLCLWEVLGLLKNILLFLTRWNFLNIKTIKHDGLNLSVLGCIAVFPDAVYCNRWSAVSRSVSVSLSRGCAVQKRLFGIETLGDPRHSVLDGGPAPPTAKGDAAFTKLLWHLFIRPFDITHLMSLSMSYSGSFSQEMSLCSWPTIYDHVTQTCADCDSLCSGHKTESNQLICKECHGKFNRKLLQYSLCVGINVRAGKCLSLYTLRLLGVTAQL